jgi:proteic killer suppression protein
MIKTFKDKRTAAIFGGQYVRGMDRRLQHRALAQLQQIDQAEALNDLSAIPGNRLERLRGDRADQWSVRINRQWRICFVWRDGHAEDVEVVDYH